MLSNSKFLKLFIYSLLFFSCKKNLYVPIHPSTDLSTTTYPFRNYLGVNLFEWNYVNVGSEHQVDDYKMDVVKGFSTVRHYLDWERIESTKGLYTFNPSHSGNWNFDAIYERSKREGITVLVCLKTIPNWLYQTYPAGQRDFENVPAPYGLDKSLPASYIAQAKAGFQFAARYGANANIDSNLIMLNTKSRWPEDPVNEIKLGLNLVKYIECGNERDRWWRGDIAGQTAEQYAANLSAFYDGHKGTLGKNVGVKTADKTMQVVMSGLSLPNPEYVVKMIEWCRTNRGYNADGSINLCFDVINYHIYPNDSEQTMHSKGTAGFAPEVTLIEKFAKDFLMMATEHAPNLEVWMTETGYDISQESVQRAIPIGEKSAYITQADWNLRTALLYARNRISRSMFFMLENVEGAKEHIFSSSGFINPDYTKRPTWYYTKQALTLLGNYHYQNTISLDPIVDVYKHNEDEIYVLTVPDQKNRTTLYNLDLGNASKAIIYNLSSNSEVMEQKIVHTTNGKLDILVTETPIFVKRL